MKVSKQHPRKLSFCMQADFKLKRQNMFFFKLVQSYNSELVYLSVSGWIFIKESKVMMICLNGLEMMKLEEKERRYQKFCCNFQLNKVTETWQIFPVFPSLALVRSRTK